MLTIARSRRAGTTAASPAAASSPGVTAGVSAGAMVGVPAVAGTPRHRVMACTVSSFGACT